MLVFVGFEKSQKIANAFRQRGHIAFSCDIQECSGDHPEYHFKGRVEDYLYRFPWDIMIMHPVCTKMSVSGNHKYAAGKPDHWQRIEAVQYTENLWHICKKICNKVCFENPVGVLSSMSNLPSPQYIQPYDFGEDASKKTALFLHGLPPLFPTKRFNGRIINGKERWSNQTDSGQNKLGPSKNRSDLRSETYQGIAAAMASQWG